MSSQLPLPPGWVTYPDPSGSGRMCYIHTPTNTTSWNPPAPDAAAAPPPPPPLQQNPSQFSHQSHSHYAQAPPPEHHPSQQRYHNSYAYQNPTFSSQPQPQPQQSYNPAPQMSHHSYASGGAYGGIGMHPPPTTLSQPLHPTYQPMSHHQPSHMPSAYQPFQSKNSFALSESASVTPVSLEFRASGLKNRDFISKSDPVLRLYEPTTAQPGASANWQYVGSTEVKKNSRDPAWATRIRVLYMFEKRQPLRVEITDVDNWKTNAGQTLGGAEFILSDVVRNGVLRAKVSRFGRNDTKWGELIVRAHNENGPGRVRVHLSLSAQNVPKMDLFGQSDPYYVISQIMPNSSSSVLHKSEQLDNNPNPVWKPHTLELNTNMQPWQQVRLNIKVFDWDKLTPHDAIGEADCTLGDLASTKAFPLQLSKKALKNSKKKQCLVQPDRLDVTEMPSFVSYLQGGLKLDFVVAVDFTVSNKPVTDPASLHFMGNGVQSPYYQALQAVGSVIVNYIPDQWITALGFGAKVGGEDTTSFNFPLNLSTDPRVHGVQGLVDAYMRAHGNVKLASPTNFSPIIRQTISFQQPVSQHDQHFTVLLFLTDGVITDLAETIDAIIDASFRTPLAIVIVGIGNTDFSNMKRLDGDDHVLQSNDGSKKAKHDIVHFTKYDPTKPIEELSAHVLHEVPQRVVEYLIDEGIKPNTPPEYTAPPLDYTQPAPDYAHAPPPGHPGMAAPAPSAPTYSGYLPPM